MVRRKRILDDGRFYKLGENDSAWIVKDSGKGRVLEMLIRKLSY